MDRLRAPTRAPEFLSADVGHPRVSTVSRDSNSPDYTYLSFTCAREFNRPTHTIPMSDGGRKPPAIG